MPDYFNMAKIQFTMLSITICFPCVLSLFLLNLFPLFFVKPLRDAH